jgi:hypothetical protein
MNFNRDSEAEFDHIMKEAENLGHRDTDSSDETNVNSDITSCGNCGILKSKVCF